MRYLWGPIAKMAYIVYTNLMSFPKEHEILSKGYNHAI